MKRRRRIFPGSGCFICFVVRRRTSRRCFQMMMMSATIHGKTSSSWESVCSSFAARIWEQVNAFYGRWCYLGGCFPRRCEGFRRKCKSHAFLWGRWEKKENGIKRFNLSLSLSTYLPTNLRMMIIIILLVGWRIVFFFRVVLVRGVVEDVPVPSLHHRREAR